MHTAEHFTSIMSDPWQDGDVTVPEIRKTTPM